MLYRDFFRILIRIVGAYLFVTLILGAFPLLFSFNVDIFFGFIQLALSFVILYLFIRFPDSIINLLRLDKGLDNDRILIPKFNERKLILLAVFLIGGYLVVSNFARFIIDTYYISTSYMEGATNMHYGGSFWVSFIHILLGWILITFRKNIADYFEKVDKNKD